MEVVELRVRLHCKACEKSVRRALCKLKGVTCVDVDVISSKVTVLGYVDQSVVIKAVRKTGRQAAVLPSCRRRDLKKSRNRSPRNTTVDPCKRKKIKSRYIQKFMREMTTEIRRFSAISNCYCIRADEESS